MRRGARRSARCGMEGAPTAARRSTCAEICAACSVGMCSRQAAAAWLDRALRCPGHAAALAASGWARARATGSTGSHPPSPARLSPCSALAVHSRCVHRTALLMLRPTLPRPCLCSRPSRFSQECREFKNGRCSRGDACRFSHVGEPGRPPAGEFDERRFEGGDEVRAQAPTARDTPREMLACDDSRRSTLALHMHCTGPARRTRIAL